jgi:hypothetical protein
MAECAGDSLTLEQRWLVRGRAMSKTRSARKRERRRQAIEAQSKMLAESAAAAEQAAIVADVEAEVGVPVDPVFAFAYRACAGDALRSRPNQDFLMLNQAVGAYQDKDGKIVEAGGDAVLLNQIDPAYLKLVSSNIEHDAMLAERVDDVGATFGHVHPGIV